VSAKPLLFMDVDGVLNPFGATPDGFDEFAFFPGEDEPVRLTPVHGEWLVELGEVFEIAWATGWGDHANRILAPHFGLPEYPVVVVPSTRFDPADKVPAVAAYAGERPAAWVDDIVTPEARAWAARRAAPTLLLDVDPAVGLVRAQVDELLEWAGWSASRSRG
jgi:hypothetical protein